MQFVWQKFQPASTFNEQEGKSPSETNYIQNIFKNIFCHSVNEVFTFNVKTFWVRAAGAFTKTLSHSSASANCFGNLKWNVGAAMASIWHCKNPILHKDNMMSNVPKWSTSDLILNLRVCIIHPCTIKKMRLVLWNMMHCSRTQPLWVFKQHSVVRQESQFDAC